MNKVLSALVATAVASLVPMAAALAQQPAPPLSGEFEVFMVTIVGATEETSQATAANYLDAIVKAHDWSGEERDPDANPHYSWTVTTYVGPLNLDLRSTTGQSTVQEWFSSGGGTTVEPGTRVPATHLGRPLSAAFDGTDPASRITTIFLIIPMFPIPPGSFTLQHDDGVSVYEGTAENPALKDMRQLGSRPEVHGVRMTEISGYTGGPLAIIYAAANANPSTLAVVATPAL